MSGILSSTRHSYKPSNARLLTLGGFTPVPRGAVAAPPAMPSWPVKDPNDLLDYAVDLSPAVVGDDGDSAVSVNVISSPSSTGDVVINSISSDGLLVVLWIGGGNTGTIYTIDLNVTLASGRVLSRSIALPVYTLSGAAPTTANLVTETGANITDGNGNPIVVGS